MAHKPDSVLAFADPFVRTATIGFHRPGEGFRWFDATPPSVRRVARVVENLRLNGLAMVAVTPSLFTVGWNARIEEVRHDA